MDRNQMLISLDAKKALNIIKHPFKIKVLENIGMKGHSST